MESLESRDTAAVTLAWPHLTPYRTRPLTRGANNTAYLIDGNAGRFVLRMYRNHADVARLSAEFEILRALQQAPLPFAIPAPIATVDGQLYIEYSDAQHGDRLAALFPLLPGKLPNRHDAVLAHAAGEALGQLQQALANVPLPSEGMIAPLGAFRRRYPALPNLDHILGSLHIDTASAWRILTLHEQLSADLPALYAALPCQLIHGDYDASNVLMEDGRISAILDFEFSSYDLRVLDLTFAVSMWPSELLGSVEEWPIIDALGRGYASQIHLTDGEVAALPTLLQLRNIGTLLHRLMRLTQRLESPDVLTRRIAHTLWREDWLAANREKLIQMVAEWPRA